MTGIFMTLSYVVCMGISWASPPPQKPVPMDTDTNNNTNSNANDNNENDNQVQSSNPPPTLTGKKRGASELECNQTDSNSNNTNKKQRNSHSNKTKEPSPLNCSTNNTSHPATSFSQIPSALLQEIALHSKQQEIINFAKTNKQSRNALANSVGQDRKDNARPGITIRLTVKQFIEKISTYPFFYDADFTITVESPEAFTQLCHHPEFKKSLRRLKLTFSHAPPTKASISTPIQRRTTSISERITPSQWLDFATALQQSEITSLSILYDASSLAALSKALGEVKGDFPKLSHLSYKASPIIPFVNTLSRFPNLQSLELEGYQPNDYFAKALSNQFPHLPKLRAINLGMQQFPEEVALNLIEEAKAHCKELTPRPLPHLPQDLDPLTARYLVTHPDFFNVLPGRGSQYGLKMRVYLNEEKNHSLTQTVIQELLQFDLPYRDKVTQVRPVYHWLTGHWDTGFLEDNQRPLAQAISFFPNITQVDIRRLTYVSEKLRQVLSNKPIKDLKISIPSAILPDNSMGGKPLESMTEKQHLQKLLGFIPQMKNLDSLEISGKFTKSSIEAFMEATKNLNLLKFLTLSGKQLNDTAAKQLASSLENKLDSAPNLKVLDLTSLPLTPAGNEALMNALKKIQTVKPNFKIKFSSTTAEAKPKRTQKITPSSTEKNRDDSQEFILPPYRAITPTGTEGDMDESPDFTLPPTINNNSNSSIHNNNNTNTHSYQTTTPSDTKGDMDESPDTYSNNNSSNNNSNNNSNDNDNWDDDFDWSADYNPTSK